MAARIQEMDKVCAAPLACEIGTSQPHVVRCLFCGQVLAAARSSGATEEQLQQQLRDAEAAHTAQLKSATTAHEREQQQRQEELAAAAKQTERLQEQVQELEAALRKAEAARQEVMLRLLNV